MRNYDWNFGFGFGTRHPVRRGGYDRGVAGGGYGRSPMGGSPGAGRAAQGGRGGYGSQGGYGRGVYGEDYPVFGGIPGGQREGMYYGGEGRQRGGGAYGRDFERSGGWGRPGADYPRPEQQRRGGMGGRGLQGGSRYGQEMERPRGRYDQQQARQPFLPESAYTRHPELNRPPVRERWSASQYGVEWTADDAEIEFGVRQNLHQDSYIDVDRIEVEVDEGVVTLRGEVDNFLQARYAWDDTWETDGVRGVVNLLTVRTDRPAPDAEEPASSATAETPERAEPTEPPSAASENGSGSGDQIS
jgi:hypothetical protein